MNFFSVGGSKSGRLAGMSLRPARGREGREGVRQVGGSVMVAGQCHPLPLGIVSNDLTDDFHGPLKGIGWQGREPAAAVQDFPDKLRIITPSHGGGGGVKITE